MSIDSDYRVVFYVRGIKEIIGTAASNYIPRSSMPRLAAIRA